MKKNLLIFSFLASMISLTANAAGSSPFHDAKAPDVVVAIKCPSMNQWRLLESYLGERDGDVHRTFTSENEAINFMLGQASWISPEMSAMTTEQYKSWGKVYGNGMQEGFFDGPSLGIPTMIDGCQAAPVAVNVTGLGEGVKTTYFVSKSVYSSLDAGDRFFLQARLNGIRSEVARLFFDTRVQSLSPIALLDLAIQKKIPGFFYNSAELSANKALTEIIDGKIRVGREARYPNYEVTYGPTGILRSLVCQDSKYNCAKLVFAKKIETGKRFDYINSNGRDNYLYCYEATYRADGTLAQCGGFALDASGKVLNQTNEATPVMSGQTYDLSRTSSLPSDLLIADRSKVDSQVAVLETRGLKTLKSIYFLNGDLACKQTSFKNTEVTPSHNRVEITIPKGCIGLAKAVWSD